MRFYLSNQNNPIDRNHKLWKRLLPATRHGDIPPDTQNGLNNLTYGEYFSAIEAFFEAGQEDSKDGVFSSPGQVSVFLEKHGAFYHPSRVTIAGGRRLAEYVLNVALSDAGREYLDNEYNTLKRLEKEYGYPFLPKVFACREIAVDASRSVSMFMGDWFSDYHEFHISKREHGDLSGVRIWNPLDSSLFLPIDQARSVCEHAAMILTACYNIKTSEQISAWHHAAGDFVVAWDGQQTPRVKLVTVRQYAPMFKTVENSADSVLNGLLLFLLNMSIHMRLDRLDGVNDICWFDDFAVEGTLAGFFKGLELQWQADRIPESFIEYFKTFLTELAAEDMLDLFVSIANRIPSNSPDWPVIQSCLERHADVFFHRIRR